MPLVDKKNDVISANTVLERVNSQVNKETLTMSMNTINDLINHFIVHVSVKNVGLESVIIDFQLSHDVTNYIPDHRRRVKVCNQDVLKICCSVQQKGSHFVYKAN